MKFLASIDLEHLQELRDRFRLGGIPIFVEPDQVASAEAAIVPPAFLSRISLPPSWYRVHVCLEEQFDEARLLLADRNYEVRRPVDVDEFENAMERAGANRPVSLRPSDRTLNWFVGAFTAVALLVVLAVAMGIGK